MNKIKAVIIEDEFPAVRLLNKMIQKVRPEWEVTVLPGTIEGAVSWFNDLSSTYKCNFLGADNKQ